MKLGFFFPRKDQCCPYRRRCRREIHHQWRSASLLWRRHLFLLPFPRKRQAQESPYLLLRPSTPRSPHLGPTVLFEEANKGTNNVGVLVNVVRLTNLKDFGTPQFVADKLIQAEKRKYKLDSTRGGVKMIFTAAFVASNKLYLLNIAHLDKLENPPDSHT
ncbi:hypothetical protein UlMin_037729 [Ulmus minor]